MKQRIEAYGGTRFEPGKIHGKRTVTGQAQLLIAIAPVFDEGDIWVRDRADRLEVWTFHARFVMINPSIKVAADASKQ